MSLRSGAGPIPRLHVVTDDDVVARDRFPTAARRVLEAGGEGLAFHLRSPAASGRRMHELARTLGDPAREAGALLLVNDRVDVALGLGLAGVQLGRRSLPPGSARALLGPEVVLGVSVHGPDEVGTAEEGGADFLLLGTVFATPSHPGREGGGTELVEAVVGVTDRPVVAIGGMTPDRTPGVLAAGARGIATVRGIWDAPDPAGAVEDFLRALRNESNEGLRGMRNVP